MPVRHLIRVAAFVSLAIAAIPLHTAASPIAAGRPPLRLHHLGRLIALHDSLLPRLAGARRHTLLAPSTQLEIDLSLRLRDEAGLARFLHDVYDPASPQYRHFLSTGEFADRFAPSAADRNVVKGWLVSRGLHVIGSGANGLLIRTVGTARTASAAFGTRLYQYTRERERFFANATPVQLPQALTAVVAGVSGLDNAQHLRPAGMRVTHHPHSGLRAGIDGYYPDDLRAAYNMGPLVDAGLSGAGQTIALAEFADYSDQNVQTYDQQFKLNAATAQRVRVPYAGKNAKTGDDGQSEVELDIEVVHAIAPQARLLVYVSPNVKSADLVQANRMVSDNQAKIISMSWGTPEIALSGGQFTSFDQIAREAAAQGQAILAASGDQGAYDANDGRYSSGDPRNHELVVDYPSSDPWVTGVGGTSLSISSSGYVGEKVWGDHVDEEGSGGGLSRVFQRPAWQVGPGVINSYSNGSRQTPDVAADGDKRTGYAIYTVSHGKPGWHVIGGTSASSPLWAGYIALVQQYIKQTIGFLNPTLYALGQRAGTFPTAPYHDVTQGDNLYYSATSGWDYGTGWGSMDGTAFLNDLIAMGGPINGAPTGTGGPPTIVQTPPQNTISYRVIVHWEKAGSKSGLDAPGLTSSKKGTKVQLGLYINVDAGTPGLPVTASFNVIYKGKTVARSTVKSKLDTKDPTGVYSAAKPYTPKQKGTYTFLGRVAMGGETIARTATLSVK